jgi:hypothetical protein
LAGPPRWRQPRETLRNRARPIGAPMTCQACGAPLKRTGKRGRPRKFCVECVPPGTGALAAAAWRGVNRERVAGYNDARRKQPRIG